METLIIPIATVALAGIVLAILNHRRSRAESAATADSVSRTKPRSRARRDSIVYPSGPNTLTIHRTTTADPESWFDGDLGWPDGGTR
jgi:hypothetical protein